MKIETIKERLNEGSLKFYAWATYKKVIKPTVHEKRDVIKASSAVIICLVAALTMLVLPSVAFAQDVSTALGGITKILKQIVDVFIGEWGYYIGIIALAIQGIRWKLGQISVMQLGGWALGICLVFFAPNIVKGIKESAGATS